MDPLQVPVRPHVLLYLEFHLGKGYVLSENDHFGLYLYSQLRRPVTDARRDHVLEEYAGRFEVHYGSFDPLKHGLRLTGFGTYKFNKFVHELIMAELHAWVDMGVGHGNKIKHCIQTFQAKYGLREEDQAYETLYKSYQRFDDCRPAKPSRVALQPPRAALNRLEKDLKKIGLAGVVAGARQLAQPAG